MYSTASTIVAASFSGSDFGKIAVLDLPLASHRGVAVVVFAARAMGGEEHRDEDESQVQVATMLVVD